MNHLDLFSGIGGFALAVDRVWPNSEHIFCDTDLFCRAVLKKHWPNSLIYGDIRTITDTDWNRLQEQGAEQQTGGDRQFLETPTNSTSGGFWQREAIANEKGHASESEHNRELEGGFERPYRFQCDLLTGGFPCQPFSQAGRRRGTDDDRYLWPEMLRVIQLTKPTWVIAENVRGLLTIEQGVVFEHVCLDLEGSGYEVQPLIIPAVSVNAPHRRDRIWIIAHNAQNSISQRSRRGMEGGGQILERQSSEIKDARPSWEENWIEVATRLCTLDDGLPNGLPRPRGWRNAALKAVGNSIVPQVAEEIMKAIKQTYET